MDDIVLCEGGGHENRRESAYATNERRVSHHPVLAANVLFFGVGTAVDCNSEYDEDLDSALEISCKKVLRFGVDILQWCRLSTS